MYGVDSYDHVNFGNVKYVNLQRTGYQHGILMRLEGGCNPLGDNSINIRGKNVPLSQWVAGNYSKNADYTWNIDDLYTQNKVGDYSYNYNGRNQWVYVYPSYYQRQYGLTFADANADVDFTDGGNLWDHRDFNCNFNWWTPQRISFGSALIPEKVYKASVSDANALITHVNATTSTPSLNVNNVVLTWRDEDGNVVDAPTGYTVAWNAAPDTSKATEVGEPNRSGNVVVTLKSGKQEIVSVPVNVLSAYAINGLTATQNKPETIPSAEQVTDATEVNRFGISSINWLDEPDVSEINPAAPGRVQVNYSDGTSQILTPTINVKGAEVVYRARVNDADALNTHVGANISVPSLNPENIHFTWTDQDGNIVAAPQNYNVRWETSPDTTKATPVGEPNRQGEVLVTVNNQSFYVNVPVNVYTARTQHDGYKIKQNDSANMPSAGYMTDTSDVDRFGVRDVEWQKKPDISNPGAEVYGQSRVNYDDGTYQDLDPYVDVIGVEDGRDHKDDSKLYRTFAYYQNEIDYNGQVRRVKVTKHQYRIKYTDYAYPVGDSERETYSDWKTLN